jgi:hypothetical protein
MWLLNNGLAVEWWVVVVGWWFVYVNQWAGCGLQGFNFGMVGCGCGMKQLSVCLPGWKLAGEVCM